MLTLAFLAFLAQDPVDLLGVPCPIFIEAAPAACSTVRLEPPTDLWCILDGVPLPPGAGSAVEAAAHIAGDRCVADLPPVSAGRWEVVAPGLSVPVCVRPTCAGPQRIVLRWPGTIFADGFESGDTGRWR